MASIDSQWNMDHMDMVDIAKQNDDYKYLLVAIDIFSRIAHCQPVKSKKGVDVVKPLQLILSGTRKPKMVITDRGIEFRSKEVNLQAQNIYHFYALNTETKASYSERLIEILKHKLFRYLMKNRTRNAI